jgi:hypothetical protein
VIVNGKEQEPVIVRFESWGALTGRLVDSKGKPYSGVLLRLRYPARPNPGMVQPEKEFVTDRDGRFRVERLLPGLKHELTLRGETKEEDIEFSVGETLKGLTAKAGEARELGDIPAKIVRKIAKIKKRDEN